MKSSKISKKAKRRIFLISTITLALIAYSFINVISVCGQMLEIKKEKNKYTNQLVSLSDVKDALELEVEKLQDPDYIAKYAREQYLYSKDGEINIKIPD